MDARVRLTETFEVDAWLSVLAGVPADPVGLLRVRIAPPRVVTRPAIEAGTVRPLTPSWEEEPYFPLDLAARSLGVTPRVAKQRCTRWGIPVGERRVNLGEPGCRHQRVLTRAGYAALTARSIRWLTGSAGGAPETLSAS